MLATLIAIRSIGFVRTSSFSFLLKSGLLNCQECIVFVPSQREKWNILHIELFLSSVTQFILDGSVEFTFGINPDESPFIPDITNFNLPISTFTVT